jgi:hypothetical protein
MSYDYNYSRERLTTGTHKGLCNINNPNRLDSFSEQIYLANEIETALPNKIFKVRCYLNQATITFEVELTAEEQTTLTTVVNNHKNNI